MAVRMIDFGVRPSRADGGRRCGSGSRVSGTGKNVVVSRARAARSVSRPGPKCRVVLRMGSAPAAGEGVGAEARLLMW